MKQETPRVITYDEAKEAVKVLLRFIGEDPTRPGLIDTPQRVLTAWQHEWGEGYWNDNIDDLVKVFPEEKYPANELVVVKDISFFSHCEHHMTPFFGKIHIGYIPADGKVLGLSKLARMANVFARRLQVQERLTYQIAECIEKAIKPQGVGVVIEAQHLCMLSRGVRQAGSFAITSALRGALLNEGDARQEFLDLCRHSR